MEKYWIILFQQDKKLKMFELKPINFNFYTMMVSYHFMNTEDFTQITLVKEALDAPDLIERR